MNSIARIYFLLSAFLLVGSPALADRYILPPEDIDLVGSITYYEVVPGSIPIDIARRRGIGQDEFLAANPLLKRFIPVSSSEYQRVVLPTRYILPSVERQGIVVNLAEKRMYYYPVIENTLRPAVLLTYAVSIGQSDWQTPVTSATVIRRKEKPNWYPPASIKLEAAERGVVLPDVVLAGPDNPLGQHALYLDKPGYLIHGTSNPDGIGLRVTHGCIRMYPEDIHYLFSQLPMGTQVNIVHEPVKLGWSAGKLYMEVHAPLSEYNYTDGKLFNHALALIEVALKERPQATVLSRRMRQIIETKSGLPTALNLSYRNER